MSFSAVPKYMFNRLTDISAGFLKERGISFLMLDLDNTVAAYSARGVSAEVADWHRRLSGEGILMFIVSNTHNEKRVKRFAGALGVGYICRANKPSRKGLCRSMEQSGKTRGESALVGDQVYTDILAANLAGVLSIAVRPISLVIPIFTLRYALETPFRRRCKNKMPGVDG